VKRAVPAALALAGFVAGLFPIFDGDLFWHLASGRWIVENGAVPRLDPFRFSASALPWIDHEWLFQIAVYALERVAGLDGVIVARAAALAGFGLLLHAVAARGGLGAGLAGFVALGAVLGVRPRFLDRPEIVTLFAVVLLLAGLERRATRAAGEGARPWRGLGALLVLVVVWVNCHGAALLAPGLAGLFLLGAAIDERASGGGDGHSRWRQVLGIPALLASALLVNPYGWRLVEVPIGIRAALADLAAVNPEWLSAWRAPQPYLFGGMAATLAVAVVARRARGRWVAPQWGLPALALGALALSAVRHQALFYAAAAPFAARCLAALPEARAGEARRERRLAAAFAVVALLAAAWTAFPPASGPLRPRHGGLRWGLGLAPERFPQRAVGQLVRRPETGPLYNEFLHGGYLLWRLHPPRQVFLDGRMELEPRLLHELVAARRDPAAWRELLTARGATGALVRYEPRRVPILEPDGRGGFTVAETRTANSYLFPRELWDLVDWDDAVMLFLAPGSAGGAGEAYRFVDPEDPERTLRLAARDPASRLAVLAELERKLADQPDCRRARELLERVRALGAAVTD